MKLYFDDEDFDGQLQRSVGKADSGMANVGEWTVLGLMETRAIGFRPIPGRSCWQHEPPRIQLAARAEILVQPLRVY